MSRNIQVNAVHTIVAGRVDEVRAQAALLIDKVKANEPGYLRYEWFLSDDESKFIIVGLLADSAAVMAHMANVGEMVGRLSEIAPASKRSRSTATCPTS